MSPNAFVGFRVSPWKATHLHPRMPVSLENTSTTSIFLEVEFFLALGQVCGLGHSESEGFRDVFLRGNVTFQYISFNLTFSHNWVIEYLECSQEIPGPGTEDAQTFSLSKIRVCFTVPVC